ncbi:MAG TPA: DUF1028 domain-containing protein [Vicinamibacteria bacterium]|jgi:uncharacterized Ntn-hydrolase superfamily protein
MQIRFSLFLGVAVLVGLAPAGANQTPLSKELRPAGTFSIVARDPSTGELGVGVQSHWFSVGSNVSWAGAGVGAVATQSFIDPGYGPRGLALMKSGKPAPEALQELLAVDASRDVRQVAFIDAQGRVAVHTGAKCIPFAGDRTGVDYSTQGNLLASSEVWEAMGRAFEGTEGDLGDRILAALQAGQDAGGDARGRQSAALLVVRRVSEAEPWKNRVVDLRVEDDVEPIAELARLYKLRKAYDLATEGDDYFAAQNFEKAFEAYNAALVIVPDNDELIFWRGAMLMNAGREAEAVADIKRAIEMNPRWLALLGRIQEEHFPGARKVLEQVR